MKRRLPYFADARMPCNNLKTPLIEYGIGCTALFVFGWLFKAGRYKLAFQLCVQLPFLFCTGIKDILFKYFVEIHPKDSYFDLHLTRINNMQKNIRIFLPVLLLSIMMMAIGLNVQSGIIFIKSKSVASIEKKQPSGEQKDQPFDQSKEGEAEDKDGSSGENDKEGEEDVAEGFFVALLFTNHPFSYDVCSFCGQFSFTKHESSLTGLKHPLWLQNRILRV